MWIYIFLLILLLCSLVYEQQTSCVYSPRTRGAYAFFVVSLLGLVVGLRDMIGGSDVYVYANVFENLAKTQEFSWKMFFSLGTEGRVFGAEPGWLLYNLVVGVFTSDSYIFFLVTAVLSYLSLFRHLRKYAPYFFFALLIIFCRQFLQSFIYVRQFFACMLVWFALDFAIKRKLIPFLVIVFCAMNIHISGLLFAVVYPVARWRISWWIMLSGFSVALLLGLTPGFANVLNTFGELVENEKALGYSENSLGGAHVFYLVEGILISLVILITRKKVYCVQNDVPRGIQICETRKCMQGKNEEIEVRLIALFNITFLYVCASLTTLQSPGCMRLIWVFWIGPICMLPYVLEKIISGRISAVFKLLIIMYFIAAFWLFLNRFDNGDLMNYKTFLY